MRMRPPILLLVLCLSGIAPSIQAQLTQSWQRTFDGPIAGDDTGNAAAIDANGDVLVIGSSTNSGSATNLYVAKYAASDGHIVWQTRGTRSVNVPHMAIDAGGNVIAAGTVGVDPSNPNNSDLYVAKFSGSSGALVWEYTYSGAGGRSDVAFAVTVNSAGDVFVTGNSRLNDFSPMDTETYTAKLSGATGAAIWAAHYNSSQGIESPSCIGLDGAGNVFVGGEAATSSAGSEYPSIIKYSPTGVQLWAIIDTTLANAGVNSLAVNAAGDVFISTSAYNAPRFYTEMYRGSDGARLWQTGAGATNHSGTAVRTILDSRGNVLTAGYATRASDSMADFYTAKYDPGTGQITWQQFFDGGTTSSGLVRDDLSFDLAVDAEDNPVVVGFSSDPSSGQPQMMLIKYTAATGSVLWQKKSTGGNNNVAKAVAVAPGVVAVTGQMNPTASNLNMATTFYKDGSAPSISGTQSSQIGIQAATLGASVKPGSWTTNVVFDYGTTTGYGSVTNPAIAIGNGTAAVPVTAPLTGLAPHTKYFYRARTTNVVGTTLGSGASFTTLDTAPTAQNDVIHSTTGSQIVFDPRANDSDPDGDALTVTTVGSAAHGTVATNGALITYDGGAGFNGNDVFSYKISDGFGGTASATVTIHNVAPTAGSLALHPPGGNSFQIDVSALVADADGDSLSIVSVGQSSHGAITFWGKVISYTVNDSAYSGNDTFTYTVTDGAGGFATGEIVLVNSFPVATNAFLHSAVDGKGGITVDLSGLISDADEDSLSVINVTPGVYGSVAILGSSLRYTPNSDYTGNDSFSYSIADGRGAVATGGIYFSNRAPQLQDDIVKIEPGTAAVAVLANDGDPDGDHLTILSVSGAALGTVTTDGAKAYYTPGGDFEGVDGFDYVAGDGHGGVARAHVSLKADYPVVHGLAVQNEVIAGLDGAQWRSFGLPSIYAQGEESGWLARYRKAGRTINGIFTGKPGAPLLRVSAGQAATDANGKALKDTVFSVFQQPVFAGNEFAFAANVTGNNVGLANDRGIWIGDATGLHAVARTNNAAPGTIGDRFSAFTYIAMPVPGVVFFLAKLQSSGKDVTATTDSGLWVWTAENGLSAVLREGETLNFHGGARTLKSFQALGLVNGSAGHARYDVSNASVDARLVFTDGSQAIVAVQSDGATKVVRVTGEADDSGRVAAGFGVPSSPGGDLGPVAKMTYQVPGQHAVASAIYDFDVGKVIAEEKKPAAGLANGVFQKFFDPVAGVGQDGVKTIAFEAMATGAAGSGNRGIWVATPGGSASPTLVALKGAVPPGAPEAVYSEFESLTIMEGRGVVFVSRLSRGSGSVGKFTDRGCWATASDGTLRLILREGDVIQGKTLRSFDLLEAAPHSEGQRRAWAEGDVTPRLIYRAQFSDGTEAILTVTVP